MKSLEIIDIYNQALEYNKKSQEIIKFFNEEKKI